MSIQKTKNLKAIILSGSRDFGRCPLASDLPLGLWPVMDRPVVEHLLESLETQNIAQVTICSNGDCEILESSISYNGSMELNFMDEELPLGTAGCIRDAIGDDKDSLFLIIHTGIISIPEIGKITAAHLKSKASLTVMLTEDRQSVIQTAYHLPEVFICTHELIKHIPAKGYFDIKEELIPAMIRGGDKVNAEKFSAPVISFHDREGYLQAISDFLHNCASQKGDIDQLKLNDNIWLADTAKLGNNARVYGPAAIMDNAVISRDAIIFGPATIGKNVSIGSKAVVEKSAIFDNSTIGDDCHIKNSIIASKTEVPAGVDITNQAVCYGSENNTILKRTASSLKDIANRSLSDNAFRKAGIMVLGLGLVWSYRPEIKELFHTWSRSDEYSFGMMVPLLALYILWIRRYRIRRLDTKPSLWGVVFLVMAQGLRYFGMFFMYASAERVSLVLSIVAIAMLLFGWRFCWKLGSIFLFLLLMLPLPRSIHTAVMLPLQNLATTLAVFMLETVGQAAVRQGNIIHLDGSTIAVAEACNGLRMVTSFFIIIGFVVLLSRRSWWQKAIAIITGIPVAIICNAIRLAITAITFSVASDAKLEQLFHDFSGYAMMPLALAMIFLELWFLSQLTDKSEKEVEHIFPDSPGILFNNRT